MIGAAELRLMKREALLINTARGALIDSPALVEALEAGVIGGAGIDVLADEPPPDDEPLLRPDHPEPDTHAAHCLDGPRVAPAGGGSDGGERR